MTLKKAISVLRKHNKWRRGADIKQLDPKEIGEAIDKILEYFKNKGE